MDWYISKLFESLSSIMQFTLLLFWDLFSKACFSLIVLFPSQHPIVFYWLDFRGLMYTSTHNMKHICRTSHGKVETNFMGEMCVPVWKPWRTVNTDGEKMNWSQISWSFWGLQRGWHQNGDCTWSSSYLNTLFLLKCIRTDGFHHWMACFQLTMS